MKSKHLYLVFCIFLFLSCDSSGGAGNETAKPDVPPRQFWVQNWANTGQGWAQTGYIQLEAELLADGKLCRVWVEKGIGFSTSKANEIARAYDNRIYPRLLNTFGIKGNINYQGNDYDNIIELANFLGNGDGKLDILLFDTNQNVSYFTESDFGSQAQYSNNGVIVYIGEARESADEINGLIAHEVQHLITYVTGLVTNRQRGHFQDAWINEGLSTVAEWIFYGKYVEYRSWPRFDENQPPVSGLMRYIYTDPFLLFQWLRLQAGTTDIWLDIITSSYSDYRAITMAADKYMPGQGYNNWETLFRTWLAANYINAPTGPYGYRNDSALRNFKAGTYWFDTSVSLWPGDAAYSRTNNFTLPRNSGNIRYVGLRLNPPELSDTTTFDNGILLTYNISTNFRGNPETGITTGE